MTTPRASGPLWVMTLGDYTIINKDVIPSHWAETQRVEPGAIISPGRLIPGHGKVVPVELVEAIWENWDDAFDAGDHDERMADLLAAIRAALEGSI
jgi:hypothetical protein